jgi:hypothetical protein
MALLFNRAKMTTATTGTGAATALGSAVDSFQTFAAAGVTDGVTVPYGLEQGDTDWEVGTGVYTAAGTVFTRTPTESSNAGGRVNLDGTAVVFSTMTKAAYDDKEDADAAILKSDTTATLTAGIDSDVQALGTITSGTVTLEVDAVAKENFKSLTANGAFTLAPPSTSSSCTILMQVTNGASAGAITTTGFTIVNGDTYATTSGNDYFFHVKKVGSFTSLTIEALQ